LRGLRSRGPIAVSASIISRFGLRLGGSSTGRAIAGSVVGSIVPLDHFDRTACLCFKRGLDVLDHGLELLVRQLLDQIAVLNLVLARDQQRQNLQVCGRLCSAHTFNRLRPAVPEVSEQGRNTPRSIADGDASRPDRRQGFLTSLVRTAWRITLSVSPWFIVSLNTNPLMMHQNHSLIQLGACGGPHSGTRGIIRSPLCPCWGSAGGWRCSGSRLLAQRWGHICALNTRDQDAVALTLFTC